MTHAIRAVLTGAVALAMAAGAMRGTSARADERAVTTVSLAGHVFGHFDAPDAVVASADPHAVGWYQPAQGATFGPWSFDVAPDGSVWLLDEVNDRLLVWPPNGGTAPPRVVRLPFTAATDMAIAPDGTVYVGSCPATQPCVVDALSPSAAVRWRSLLPEQRSLGTLVVVDGVLYHQFTTWTPVTDAAGRPLSSARQQALASPDEPLPGGQRLVEVDVGNPVHEIRLTLRDRAGTAEHTWQVTSDSELGTDHGAHAAIVGDDVVVALSLSHQSGARFDYDVVVLRLPLAGPLRYRLTLEPPARAVFGEYLTALRVGPDGAMYQLRSSRTSGVTIARYAMGPVVTPPTTTTSTAAPTTSPTAPATRPVVPPTAAPRPPASSSRAWIAWLLVAITAFVALAAAVVVVAARQRAAR